METAIDSDDDFDWTIICRSRVVGCAAPSRISFAEFRHLNCDERNPQLNTPQGIYDLHCGFDNVLLAWTGPEYMYHMLRRNETAIPDEGLAMLRLFALGDWHTHHEYEHLANVDDQGLKPFVYEFDQLRRLVSRNCGDLEEMTDRECSQLWEEHYRHIVEKYGLGGQLVW
mmetsp:Transcript_5460/g.12107  ORF Transcript_5460/g.12107 Transcript_5460/m.12107 type:complete len:170 (+) Transcript_5460:1009-1518(+)